ncbi:MAG: porphobilinogen deaminase [Candidatus Desulfovibrio kirbyi]|uniref:Porphobilinogen deaminase n=1 Tax=Candidatus Desulfovibrio kirbyi TaxID=2696086 RepID=A0A6L2R5A0_9BACT|nr:MAG: porphobilinogen deaminase [Candidatus Desulfovibrio kirbyi]
MSKSLTIATRGSRLAIWQAEHIKSRLQQLCPDKDISLNMIKTTGDVILDAPLSRIGGKGVFVKEIEEALLRGKADLAVHSIKDVPTDLPDGLTLACIPAREECADCLLSVDYRAIHELPQNARVGTSSLRRQAQLLAQRPDLRIADLRGNVDTRLRKLRDNKYDAIVLASAGIKRLRLSAPHICRLDPEHFLPAAGQGALGIECRKEDSALREILLALDDAPTRVCVEAERAFLAALEGGCQAPIAVHARLCGQDGLLIDGLLAGMDGSVVLRERLIGPASHAAETGFRLAETLLDMGGRALLKKIYPQQ